MRKPAVKGSDGRGKSRAARATAPARIEDAPDMTAPDIIAPDMTAPVGVEPADVPAESTLETEASSTPVPAILADEMPVAVAAPVEADAPSTDIAAPDIAVADPAPADAAAGTSSATPPGMPIESPVIGTGEPTVTDPAANAVFATSTAEPTQPEPAPTNTSPNSTGMEKVMKTTEEFFAFGQGNLEAIIKAGQIWATGMQDLSKQMTAGAQANLDETMAAFKAMSSAKTLKDAIDMQTGFARSTFEKSMTETGKLTDASMKLAEQALAPITARVTTAMDSFVKAA